MKRSSVAATNAVFLGAVLGVWGCNGNGAAPEAAQEALAAAPGVGLALEIDNGAGIPLTLRAGQRFYIEQIDLRAFIDSGSDEGVAGLAQSGAAAALAWHGVALVDEEPVLLPNPDNTFTRRRFYRDAAWMSAPSWFVVEQLDDAGRRRGAAVIVGSGLDDARSPLDDFFVRRMRAIQWTNDCPAPNDCSGAHSFMEEALVELRNSLHRGRTFVIDGATTHLRVWWTADPRHPYDVPVTQVAAPQYDYGFAIDVAALTPPAADGAYAPGSDVTLQLTLRDGAGQRLHAPGALPSFFEAAVLGLNPAGINYFRAFFDPTATYYRRKHRERNFAADIVGPLHKVQNLRTVTPIPAFFAPTQVVATPAVDGVYSEAVFFPQGKIFPGAFDPTHAAWFEPGSDTWTFHLPPDAEPGTYEITVKARRTYLGEDVAATATLKIQVGTTQATSATLATAGCDRCHQGGGALAKVLHADSDRGTCNGCHVPIAFELENSLVARVHFIHSRSRRVGAEVERCAICHTTQASIQRTSKSACLSCHKTYPDSHVALYGPITSMYVGDYFLPDASFAQCSTTCHTTHPDSGL